MTDHRILLGDLTRREFRNRMRSGELRACILPVAAIEQHLEHLAMEHDWRSVNLIAQEVAQRLAPQVLVAQGVMAGISEHHMRHPGTLSLRPGTFLSVVADLIRSLKLAGFENILVLNGHGGNIAACQATWDQFLREFSCNLHFLSYWDVLNAEDAQLLQSGQRLPDDLPGHAQEFETSIAAAAFPANIRSEAINDQADPSPGLATPQLGQQMIQRVVERVTVYLGEMLEGSRTQPEPPYHP